MISCNSDQEHNNETGKIHRTLEEMREQMKVTREEISFREENLKNGQALEDYSNYLKCTKCSLNFRPVIEKGDEVDVHPLLQVLMCEACCDYYGDGEFSLDIDGEDKYCRWCGEGGTILYCSKCICGFCDLCLKKHFGKDGLERIQNDDDWICYICDPKPLWYLRFISSWAAEISKSHKVNDRSEKESSYISRNEKLNTETVVIGSLSSSENEKSEIQMKKKKTKILRNSKKESSGSEAKTPRKRKKLEENDLSTEEKENDYEFEVKRTIVMERLKGIWTLTKTMSEVGLDSSKERLKKLSRPCILKTPDSLTRECEKLKAFVSMTSSFLSTISSSVASVNVDIDAKCVRNEEKDLQLEVIKFKKKIKSSLQDSVEESSSEETCQRKRDFRKRLRPKKGKAKEEKYVDSTKNGEEKKDEGFMKSNKSSNQILKNRKSELSPRNAKEIENHETAKPLLKVRDFAKMIEDNLYDTVGIKKSSQFFENSKGNNIVSNINCKGMEIKEKTDANSEENKSDSLICEKVIERKNSNLEGTKSFDDNNSSFSSTDCVDSSDTHTKKKVKKPRNQRNKLKKSFEMYNKSREKYLDLKNKKNGEKNSEKEEEKGKCINIKRCYKRILVLSDEENKEKESSKDSNIIKEGISEKYPLNENSKNIEDNSSSSSSENEQPEHRVSSGATSSEDSSFRKGKFKKAKNRKKRLTPLETRSDSDQEKEQNTDVGRRKKIKKILTKEALHVETKVAIKNEEERRKRIEEREKLFNELFPKEYFEGKSISRDSVLDFDPETKEPLVTIHKNLMDKLKPHQVQGVKFMWNNCFESVKRLEEDSGSGCLLAHCLGLGKTLQVVTFIHSIFSHNIGVNTVLVVAPLNTLTNWKNEFEMWLGNLNTDPIPIYDLLKNKRADERLNRLKDWQKNGGVMIITYDLFRNLTKESKGKRKKRLEVYGECLLDPGPDLVFCDEGHLLKNQDSVLFKCMNKIKTSRRVVLTGTPLQNNLMEYHCMVQFVKPNILGTKKEFLNRFMNPIVNGQFEDSTELDVKIMKRRSHVLHSILAGCVQRFDYSVLTPYLPQKYEYVLSISLTGAQAKVYRSFISEMSQKAKGNTKTANLFNDYHHLQRIWTHPKTMLMHSEKLSQKEMNDFTDTDDSLENFIVDTDEDETTSNSSSSNSFIGGSKNDSSCRKRVLRSNKDDLEVQKTNVEEENTEKHWWEEVFAKEDYEDMRASNKLVILFWLLKHCEERKDKVLVFSQSLYSLDLIEDFLKKIDDESGEKENDKLCGYRDSWVCGLDYFRMDGGTNSETRAIYCKTFNEESNTRARLFLISTRAGGLGINLCAANRVIMFDASWNPSHDVQSIFRVYRFGQKKPCYIYRFLAEATMEEKIYKRQVTKLSLALRVVDELQIERHYSMMNLQELYEYDPLPKEARKVPVLPKDEILAELLRVHKDIIVNYHEHDSLLQNQEEEELSEEERMAAWKEYEEEKNKRVAFVSTPAPVPALASSSAVMPVPLHTTSDNINNVVAMQWLPPLLQDPGTAYRFYRPSSSAVVPVPLHTTNDNMNNVLAMQWLPPLLQNPGTAYRFYQPPIKKIQ